MRPFAPFPAVLLLVLGAVPAAERTTTLQRSPRERMSINDGWRFAKGDPPGSAVSLLYDVRPEVSDEPDDRPADAEPRPPVEADTRSVTLKPWILPTGNPFIKDPSGRHARPAGPAAMSRTCVQPDFDDRTWRAVNLPHDWAIEGPFLTSGPHGGMGRLPSGGVAWYRRRLDVPASDAGRSIFLDVDGAMSYATVWINGRIAGGWPFGYASWRVDLTPHVVPGGVNQLAIRLDNPPSSSRWYPGGPGTRRDRRHRQRRSHELRSVPLTRARSIQRARARHRARQARSGGAHRRQSLWRRVEGGHGDCHGGRRPLMTSDAGDSPSCIGSGRAPADGTGYDRDRMRTLITSTVGATPVIPQERAQ